MSSESSKLEPDLKENLIHLIDRLILEKHYDGVEVLLQDNRNLTQLREICSDVVQICAKHLNDENYKKNVNLFYCCENLLKTLAQHADPKEVLFELMEIIETTTSDNQFTSSLKALQICLLRQENNCRGLEWSLNSILTYVSALKVPDFLIEGYDEKQEKLLEQNEDVHRILMNYYTISLFYEPLIQQIQETSNSVNNIFKSTTRNRRNIFISFLVQLLGKPFALMDFKANEQGTNSYSVKRAQTLATDLCKLLVDPFFLLGYVEHRIRWKSKIKDDELSHDVFMIEEKVPLDALAVFYYLLVCEEHGLNLTPKIYNPFYIFESCLYLVVEMLSCKEPSLNQKGLLLGHKILSNLSHQTLSADSLNLQVYSNFTTTLANTVVYSSLRHHRKLGIELLKAYIYSFDVEGRFLVLKMLIQTTAHAGLFGYLITTYKNLIADQLLDPSVELPKYCAGADFRNMMLNNICKLKNNEEIDIMENSDQIISALNILRFFALKDKSNRTGFWLFIDSIEKQFVEPLRKAIYLSRAHYKAEEYRVRNNIADETEEQARKAMQISVLNGEQLDANISKEQKLSMLANARVTFDLIESLLARVTECFDCDRNCK